MGGLLNVVVLSSINKVAVECIRVWLFINHAYLPQKPSCQHPLWERKGHRKRISGER